MQSTRSVAISSGSRLEEAIILCGGLGTRLGEIALDRPKALLEIRGRPFLEWLILSLARYNAIGHVILATGHLGEMIEQRFGNGSWCGVRISYSHEAQQLGTGGALRRALPLIGSEHAFVLNGDTYCRYDSRRLLEMHLRNLASATLWLTRVRDATRFGTVTLDNDGRVSEFREKTVGPGTQLVSAGAYVIGSEVIMQIEPDRPVSLEHEVLPGLVGRGLFGVVGDTAFVDIGTTKSLMSAGADLASELDQLGCD